MMQELFGTSASYHSALSSLTPVAMYVICKYTKVNGISVTVRSNKHPLVEALTSSQVVNKRGWHDIFSFNESHDV